MQRNFPFEESLDFDIAVVLRFDRETWELLYARELTVEELRPLLSPHTSGLRLTTARAAKSGRDVTDAFREAYTGL